MKIVFARINARAGHLGFLLILRFLVLLVSMARKFVMALAKRLATAEAEISFSCNWCHMASWRRDCLSTTESSFSPSLWCVWSRHSSRRHVSPFPISERRVVREKLWQEFFLDPSQWWDNRSEKVNPRYPDFKHKGTGQSLWLDSNLTPPWVEAELATVAPGLLQSDSFSWNVRLRKHLEAHDYQKALSLFRQMQREGMILDEFTFVPVLKACSNLGSLEEGRRVHEQIIQSGCKSDMYVETCLVDMYAKCGSIKDAWCVFKNMRERSVVSWNVIIGGYVKSHQGPKALELFQKMQQEGVEPNTVTFVGVLNACASVAALEEGRHAHKQIIQRGIQSDAYVATCLVDMYAKCGSIEDAWSVFNKMQERSVVSWNAIIVGYVKSEHGLKALEVFRLMQKQGVEPNTVTFLGALNACASVVALQEGRCVHELIIRSGCESDIYVSNCLIDMYAKCGSIEDAWSVFNKLQGRNVVSWNAMIAGYVRSEQGLMALELFRQMEQGGLEPDVVSFIGVLNACASLVALEEGRCVHKQIIRRGFQSNVYVSNCLVDMYAKCGSTEDARSVFNNMRQRDVVSWNAMIGGYVKAEKRLEAMELLQRMKQDGVEPDAVTFVGALNVCAGMAALQEGRRVHKQILQRGCESDVYVANCLVDMYAKCGSIRDAWSVFKRMLERSVVSWNTMIVSYVKCDQGLKALELFQKMQQGGVEPNTVTFVGVLNACASVAALGEGRRVHDQIVQREYESDHIVANCLLDMYAKCGSIDDAQNVFNNMHHRNLISWNAMIGGYAMHGHSEKAIELFKRMGKEGVEIDEITFTCLLSACSHQGLVKEGLLYFKNMNSHYNVPQTSEHYVCVVDLLGRAGWLEEAEELAVRMPMERDCRVWMALLGACRIYGNIEMAERAAKRCWELEPENASAHVLLLNIYTTAGKLDGSAAVEDDRLKRKVMKERGCTWIEVNNMVHAFVVDSKEHPQLLQVHAELESLSLQLNEKGYIPDTRFLSHVERKECHGSSQ